MMNIYGKEASAYYDLFSGLRHLKRGENDGAASRDRKERHHPRGTRRIRPTACATAAKPETDGFWAARNLAVIKAGVKSAREGRVVDVAEIIASGE